MELTQQPRSRKRIPTMVCAPRAEIVAWNRSVDAASDRLDRIRKSKGDRHLARAFKGNGQAPKFDKPRVHRQHKHELRDEHGAYTLTGGVYQIEGDGVEPTSRECILGAGVGGGMPPSYTLRRKWLAGISAQRGY